MCEPQDFSHLRLTPYYHNIVKNELEAMHAYYPIGSKQVVDLGAGQGETVQLWLNHGAERVLAIEADPVNISLLRENFGDDPRVQIVPMRVDGIKVDIDGAEKGMAIESELEMTVQYKGYHNRVYRVGPYPHYNRMAAYLCDAPRLAVIKYREALHTLLNTEAKQPIEQRAR